MRHFILLGLAFRLFQAFLDLLELMLELPDHPVQPVQLLLGAARAREPYKGFSRNPHIDTHARWCEKELIWATRRPWYELPSGKHKGIKRSHSVPGCGRICAC